MPVEGHEQPMRPPPSPELAPVAGTVHFALKSAYYHLVTRGFGIVTGNMSLTEVQSRAMARAKFAQSVVETGLDHVALIDGALDALKHGTPDDLKRARILLERSVKQLTLTLEAATSDGFHAVPAAESATHATATSDEPKKG
jgi:hypothetical protein